MEDIKEKYFMAVEDVLRRIRETQFESISKAAEKVADTAMKGGVVHLFGTGHSFLVCQEAHLKAGGLACCHAVMECNLIGRSMESMHLERLEGYGKVIFQRVNVTENDTVVVVSGSGVNPAPIEFALEGKERGLPVIAITSINFSRNAPSRHPTGKRLFEVADIVVDSCVPLGDAVIEVKGTPQKVGPVSTIAMMTIVETIIVQAVEKMVERGFEPPIFLSANIPGGDKHNLSLINRYKAKIPYG